MQQHSPPKKRRPRPGGALDTIIPATHPFLRCANFILPWLNSQEFAAVPQTCKTLSLISKSLTSHRSLENLSIPFCNSFEDCKRCWCLHADQLIKQGQFICEYAGLDRAFGIVHVLH